MQYTRTADGLDFTPERREGGRLEDNAALVARAKAGDSAAFDALMRQHEKMVIRLACRLLGNVEDAKDAAQDAFVRLYRHLHRFETDGAIEPWLYRITVNTCRDVARKRQRADGPEDAWSSGSAGPTPLQHAQAREAYEAMEKALRALPAREREALVLRDIEGLSTAEVARAMDSSETTVRSQISRARLKLRACREQALGEER